MIKGKIPANENERIQALNELEILDTIEEQAYDDLTSLASTICNTPVSLVSLIDTDRQWFMSHHGLDARETPRDFAFCGHAINGDELFIVEDADNDERFYDNPLVTHEPFVKFYAGAPLVLDKNIRIGTLCVIDHQPRKIDETHKNALKSLARQVVSQFELRLKLKELESLDHAKDEFLSMVSHELRTPLTSLIGSLAILEHQANQLAEPDQSMLSIAKRNSDHLLRIVNDILDLSKMQAGKLELEMTDVNVTGLIQQAVKLNVTYIDQCHCKAVLELPSENSIIVKADEYRLLQVLSNLISNAAKFSLDEGTITLSVSIEHNQCCVSVTNRGTGIPYEKQKMLFDKFKQLGSKSNEKLPGTGLGLSICKHIIDAHKGEIGFESIPNEATTFYFKLNMIS